MKSIKVLLLATLFTLTAVFGSGLLASEADAAMTKDEAKCRSTIFKATSKYQAGAWKAVAGCHKGKLKGKVGAGIDCNDPIQADTKGKLGKAASKIRDSLGGAKDKCADKTTGAALSNVLAVYGRCPSPGEITDDGGATDGIDDFSELADCLIAVSDSLIGLTASEVMGDPDHALLSKDLAKCQGTIGKSTAKLMATISKERGKCQAGADKAGGNIDWTCGSFDGKGKIASTGQKFKDGITKACLGDEDTLDALDSCGDTPAQLQDCLVDTIAAKVGNGMTAMLFELPGVCPSGVQVTTLAGFGQQRTSTELSLGWTGLAHGVDILDGWVGEANLACDADCDNCAVTILPVDKSMGNCRCDNDPTISCDEPFVAEDEDDCGLGNECICRFGPPLSLSTAGVPVARPPGSTRSVRGFRHARCTGRWSRCSSGCRHRARCTSATSRSGRPRRERCGRRWRRSPPAGRAGPGEDPARRSGPARTACPAFPGPARRRDRGDAPGPAGRRRRTAPMPGRSAGWRRRSSPALALPRSARPLREGRSPPALRFRFRSG